MYLVIEDNSNCEAQERVFSELGNHRPVSHLRLEGPDGTLAWWETAAVNSDGSFGPAQAVQVEDSGAGNAWLIFGSNWGLRFRQEGSKSLWSLTDSFQWGEPFKVLDISADDIRFIIDK
jgi:hypothetical protein